jgi:hypothetical protein
MSDASSPDLLEDDTAASEQRRRLESRADFVRARLARRVGTLVSKERRLVHPGTELRRHPTAAIALAIGVAVLLLAGVTIVVQRVAKRRRRAADDRVPGWRRRLRVGGRVA